MPEGYLAALEMLRSAAIKERWVAVLGSRDQPTDAVAAYCGNLAWELRSHGINLELVHVKWPEAGWSAALRELRKNISGGQQTWFLLQYTALAWSRRGISLRVLKVLRLLKKSGARCAVVFHDTEAFSGDRMAHRARRIVQLYTMRQVVRIADMTLLTVPAEKISWIPKDARNVVFIPVGANLPAPEKVWFSRQNSVEWTPTVAVFSVTGGAPGTEEIKLIVTAVRYAAERIGRVRLSVLGRNSETAGKSLQAQLAGVPVEVTIHGLLASEDVVRVLGDSDVLLFTWGPLSTRRGSAIAGIACGLPVVAAEGLETTAPITEAGVAFVPPGSTTEWGATLLRVLSDSAYRASLSERSRAAQERYFSWGAIAKQYLQALGKM